MHLAFKLGHSITIVQAAVCLHNFLLTEELLLDEGDRRYAVNEVGRNDENNLNDENHFDFPRNVIEQKEMLTQYFNSEEGALR